jgi:nicotinamidase-related amidase
MPPHHPNTLDPARCALVVIDLQEAFRPVLFDFDRIVVRSALMIQGVRILNIPVIITEQSPQKLGPTVREIRDALPEETTAIDKTTFSCCGAQPFIDRLKEINARQLLICGLEAHVCVNQTVHDLLARDYQVHLLTDCISSRTPQNRDVGLSKMTRSGALPSSTELALFELMTDARHEHFRAIQKLVK